MKFEIDRKRWLRGEGSVNSRLLRPSDQKMCCLGFKAKALGLSDDTISNIPSPISIPNINFEQWGVTGLGRYAVIAELGDMYCLLFVTNDVRNISESEREERLIKLFAEIGDEVTFV